MFFDEMDRIERGMSLDGAFSRQNKQSRSEGRKGGLGKDDAAELAERSPGHGRPNAAANMDTARDGSMIPWWKQWSAGQDSELE